MRSERRQRSSSAYSSAIVCEHHIKGFAVFDAKSAKQRRSIAAILRERRKSSRERASQARRLPNQAAVASNSHETSQPMADQLKLQSLRSFNVPAHFVFAYRRTGLLVTVENEAFMSASDLRRWHTAMLEYFQIERRKKTGAVSHALH